MDQEKNKQNENVKKLLSNFKKHPNFSKNKLVLEFMNVFFTDVAEKIKPLSFEALKNEKIIFQIIPSMDENSINIIIKWYINELLGNVPFGTTMISVFNSEEQTNIIVDGELTCNYKTLFNMNELMNFMIFIHKITNKLNYLLLNIWGSIKNQLNAGGNFQDLNIPREEQVNNNDEDDYDEIEDDDLQYAISDRKKSNKTKRKQDIYEEDDDEDDEEDDDDEKVQEKQIEDSDEENFFQLDEFVRPSVSTKNMKVKKKKTN